MVFATTPAGKTVPCCSGCLPNKQEGTYRKLWTLIKETLNEGEEDESAPRVLRADFELAAHNAFKTLFPTSRTTGCFFHFRL